MVAVAKQYAACSLIEINTRSELERSWKELDREEGRGFASIMKRGLQG
jgi:hypothetical protein